METVLLLLGAAFLLICTLVFLRHAFATTLGWGLAGLLVPPSAILFYAVFWQRFRPLALLHCASLLVFVLGAALWVRAHPFAFDGSALAPLRDGLAPAYSRRPLQLYPLQFASEQKVQPYLKRNQEHAGGIYKGEPVEFVRATLVNGVLRLKTDDQLFSRLELAIPLHQHAWQQEGEVVLEFSPESGDSPPVYVTRVPEGKLTPETELYQQDFWLELMLNRQNDRLYSGYIKLRLPDAGQSFVAGSFRAFTRDLRYEDSEVDRFFDSNATIEYVSEQYLVNKLGFSLERVTEFNGTFFQVTLDQPTARTEATLKMADGSVHRVKLSLIKGSEGWVVESGPTPELISALRKLRQEPPAAIGKPSLREQVRLVAPDDVATLLGRNVVILTHDGKQREGIVSEVDQHNITLATPVDGGSMGMLVKRREVREVKLQQ